MKKAIKIGFLIVLSVVFLVIPFKNHIIKLKSEAYISSNNSSVDLYDDNLNKINTIYRGEKIERYEDVYKKDDITYIRIIYQNVEYYLLEENLCNNYEESVKESKLYVRTNVTVYEQDDDINISTYIKKGEEVTVTGFDKLQNGEVSMYKILKETTEGYVYGKYLVSTLEDALKNYDDNNQYSYHSTSLADPYRVGMAGNLDFYPEEKPKFENNKMPETVKALYLNVSAIRSVDAYIEVAKEIGANAFVVDIKDGVLAYPAEAAKDYTLRSYNGAYNSYEQVKQAVQKIIENGFYVIGRIVVFNDNNYGKDNPKDVIVYKSSQALFGGQHWLSPYCRDVWEYNVKLAIESATEFGFNEIQFDYVRFPDRTGSVESLLNFKNTYGESKAQAVQNFLMYARDELHKIGVYISADVFGESAGNFVTGYGQYWPAISNVVDVISGMAYPDHFNMHSYGISSPVWTVPEQLMTEWGKEVVKAQATISTPAIVRTWIQGHDTIKAPYIVYNDQKIKEQIEGLYNNNLTGGWMVWLGSSNINKYKTYKTSFKEAYGEG